MEGQNVMLGLPCYTWGVCLCRASTCTCEVRDHDSEAVLKAKLMTLISLHTVNSASNEVYQGHQISCIYKYRDYFRYPRTTVG